MPDNGKSRIKTLIAMLPESMVKRTAKTEMSYQERQRRAIEEAGADVPTRDGVDMGEVGKSWDETFKKNE